jgi:aromatic ring-cleaving dioxygenase
MTLEPFTETNMAQLSANPGQIRGFHAHIYYDAKSKPVAETVREAIGAQFTAVLGRWRDDPVGPHAVSMYQVAFAPEEFGRIVPWLMLNRAGLNILVHPQTGNAHADHTEHASWLGAKLPLRLEVLRRGGPP